MVHFLQMVTGSTDQNTALEIAILLIAVLMTYLPIHPVLAFLKRGWGIKRDDIFGTLGNGAKAQYFRTFQKELSAPKDPDKAFSDLYHRRYGRYRLITPIFILLIALLVLSLMIAETAVKCLLPSGDATLQLPLAVPFQAAAALTGAYIWVVSTLIVNASKYTLPPALILNSTLRLIAAIPIAYAISSVLGKDSEFVNFVSFAVGAFPLDTTQVILQRLATKKLGLDLSTNSGTEPGDQVTRLDGIDPLTADRLQSADITTISQLAYCDPIQLSMRTNYAFPTVVDMVDQALAWIYLGDKLKDIRPYGIRGAIGVFNLYQDMNSELAETKNPAFATFKAVAVATKLNDDVTLSQDGLRRGFDEIANDPYVKFLKSLWSGM